jgi:hypothetical protein
MSQLLEQVYDCLVTGVPLDTLHIPHSDVYYVRAALYKHTGVEFSLAEVEDAMIAEGWYKNTPKLGV